MNEKIKKCFEKIPLIGGLAYSQPKDYPEPIKEFSFMWFVSFLPIIFSVFIELVKAPSGPNNQIGLYCISKMFYANLNTGEVFIYATTILAPVAFLMYKYNKDELKFHNHLSFLFAVIVTIAASAVMFGLQKGGEIENKTLMNISGLVLYLLALFVWFLSLVYDNLRIDYSKRKRDEEKNLSSGLSGFDPEGGSK